MRLVTLFFSWHELCLRCQSVHLPATRFLVLGFRDASPLKACALTGSLSACHRKQLADLFFLWFIFDSLRVRVNRKAAKTIPDSLRASHQSQGSILPTWLRRLVPEHCFGGESTVPLPCLYQKGNTGGQVAFRSTRTLTSLVPSAPNAENDVGLRIVPLFWEGNKVAV
jgi:hypothetical protein